MSLRDDRCPIVNRLVADNPDSFPPEVVAVMLREHDDGFCGCTTEKPRWQTVEDAIAQIDSRRRVL